MHDGRATTLVEAILNHAASDTDTTSEARASRAAYRALPEQDKRALIAFLQNLVLFKIPEEDAAVRGRPARTAPADSVQTQKSRTRVKISPKGFKVVSPE
jgi:hypothetical protein